SCSFATWFDPSVERALVDSSDDLVASAKALQRSLAAGGRPVALVPNAVDRALFDPDSPRARVVPADFERGERTLVYAGSLWGDWFDWDVVAGTAAARPSWRILLIGDPPAERRPGLPDNVRFLGLKPQSDLPAYYAAADACLIPFAPGPVVDAVSPLKVFEYLAMRRPVVATPMPELEGLPHVFTAADAAATVAAVERACSMPAPTAEIASFLARNSWSDRAAALAATVARPKTAVIVLCYDNADVIGKCVDSLVRHRGDAGYEIVVVDNGSRDGSLDLLRAREQAGEIRLLRNVRNGCSSGRNLGVRETTGEFVVFLDSDQWAECEGWLDPALAILAAHRDVGAVAWNAGWFAPGTGGGPIVDDYPDRAMGGAHAGRPFRDDVAYLATSGFVMPRRVLARTGGFDEFYDPTCFEDTDLSFQVKAAGFRIAYCPAMALGHRPHATTGALGSYDAVRARNERYFLEKWRDYPEYFFSPA
ncbi:MAG: glycosyltransferase, partial [Alphaproteobacteria bacterium]